MQVLVPLCDRSTGVPWNEAFYESVRMFCLTQRETSKVQTLTSLSTTMSPTLGCGKLSMSR